MTNPFAEPVPKAPPESRSNPFASPTAAPSMRQEPRGGSRTSVSAPPSKGRNEDTPPAVSPRVTNPFDSSWSGPPASTSPMPISIAAPIPSSAAPRNPSPKRNSQVLDRALSNNKVEQSVTSVPRKEPSRSQSGSAPSQRQPSPSPSSKAPATATRPGTNPAINTTTTAPRPGLGTPAPTQRQPSPSPSGGNPASTTRPTTTLPTIETPHRTGTGGSGVPRGNSIDPNKERSSSPVYTGGFSSTTNMAGRPGLTPPASSTSTSRAASPSAPQSKDKSELSNLYSQSRGHISYNPQESSPKETRTKSEEPMNDSQLLQKKVEELEAANFELKKEKDSLMVTVNELYENIGKLDSRTQQLKAQVFRLEEENKNLVFEKSMIIEQLNDAFQEQTKLASALEDEKINSGSADEERPGVEVPEATERKNKGFTLEGLQKERKELKQTVKLLEAKLSLLQDQNLQFDKMLVKDQERIRELEQEKGALNDVYQTAVLRQSDLADQVWSLEKKLKQQQEKFAALAKPNPKFAIEKLEHDSESLYVYNCKSLKDKQLLLKEALLTVNPDVIIFVVSYLHFTLSAELFDAVVMAKEEACAYYLNHLKKSQSPLFKQVCLRNGRLKDLGQQMFENALAIANKVEQLKKCFDFCAKHPQETGSFSRVVEDSLNFAKIEENLSSM